MKIKKIIALLFAIALCLSMTGCNGCNGSETDNTVKPLTPTNTVSDYTHHKVEGTLHKITVTPSERVFVKNGETDYAIAVGDGVKIKTAGEFISKHVADATGVQLRMVNGSEAGRIGKHIVLGCDELFEAAGLSMPSDDLGDTGYYIKNAGDAFYIQANCDTAYQLAAIAFLREVLGYDMFSEECVIYEKSGETLPDIEVIERPDIDYRINGNVTTQAEIYGMGFSESRMYMPIKDDSGVNTPNEYHSSLNVLPPALYEKDNPEWYVVAGGVKQLCYTAHGNYDSYLKMVDTAADKIIATVESEPNFDTLNFGQSDGRLMCNCEYCTACATRYGAMSSTLLMFLDDVDDKVQAHFEQKAKDENTEKREIHLTFFAYHATLTAPVQKLGKDNFKAYTADWNSRFDAEYELPVENRELKCNKTVGILVAPIEPYHSHTLYEPINETYYDAIKGWDSITDYMCMWYYQSLFHDDYFYPLSTFDTMVENYRLARECETRIIFYQGNLHNTHNPGFTRLKRYIEAKAAIDVNVSTKELTDKFFKYYYGSAGEEMKTMFEELQAHMAYLETAFDGEVTGSSYDSQVSKSTHWPKRMLDGWMQLVEEAYEKVNKYDRADTAKYDAYMLHIRAESLLPRWSLLRNYEGYFSSEILQAMRKEFSDDCINLGITRQTEGTVLDLSAWGV